MAVSHDAGLALTMTRIHMPSTGLMSHPLKASIPSVITFLLSPNIHSLPLMQALDIPPAKLRSVNLHAPVLLAFDLML